MKLKTGLLASLIFLGGCTKFCSREQKVEEKKSVFFKSPQDGAVVTSPVEVVFGVTGMKVRPAMEDVHDKTSGHHHILIDDPKGFVEKGQAVPQDEKNIHYGKGETSTMLNLTPGIHTLTLQFADGAHLSYGKEMASTIKITVVSFEDEDLAD
jgi:hypothetical protein